MPKNTMIDFSLGNLKIRVIFLVYAWASYPLEASVQTVNNAVRRKDTLYSAGVVVAV